MDQLTRKILLFAPSASAPYRKRRLIFVIVAGLTSLSLLWPIFPMVASIYPLVLGLPFSMAWCVLCLLVVFVALYWLDRADRLETPPEEEMQ